MYAARSSTLSTGVQQALPRCRQCLEPERCTASANASDNVSSRFQQGIPSQPRGVHAVWLHCPSLNLKLRHGALVTLGPVICGFGSPVDDNPAGCMKPAP